MVRSRSALLRLWQWRSRWPTERSRGTRRSRLLNSCCNCGVPVEDAIIEGTVVDIVRLPDGKPVPAGYGLAVDCPGGGTVPAYALITRGIVIRLQSAVVDRPTRLSKGSRPQRRCYRNVVVCHPIGNEADREARLQVRSS